MHCHVFFGHITYTLRNNGVVGLSIDTVLWQTCLHGVPE